MGSQERMRRMTPAKRIDLDVFKVLLPSILIIVSFLLNLKKKRPEGVGFRSSG
jgi:hypothetical protein